MTWWTSCQPIYAKAVVNPCGFSLTLILDALTPRLNGKVERSRLTDHQESYQLLTHTDDIGLNQDLQTWEN